MAEARYELRAADVPPAELGIESPTPGVLYEGPFGPAYAYAPIDRILVRGPVQIEFATALLEMDAALADGGIALMADGRELLIRQCDADAQRAGRALEVLDGEGTLLIVRVRGTSARSIERADGTVLAGTMPSFPKGGGTLRADAQPLEVGLLIAIVMLDSAGGLHPPLSKHTRAWVEDRHARALDGARGRTCVRHRGAMYTMAALLAIVVGFCVMLGVAPLPAGVRAGFGVTGLVFAVLAVRQLIVGVYVEDGGVLVRNMTRSRRLAWSEIDRFQLGIWGGWGTFPCGIARLADGSGDDLRAQPVVRGAAPDPCAAGRADRTADRSHRPRAVAEHTRRVSGRPADYGERSLSV